MARPAFLTMRNGSETGAYSKSVSVSLPIAPTPPVLRVLESVGPATKVLPFLAPFALAEANFLKKGKPDSPFAKPLFMRRKRCGMFGFAKEAIMDVPRRRLDLTLLLEGVLVGIASRTRFLAGNRKASNLRRPRGQHIRAWPLARDPPPRIVSWSRLVFNTCAPQPLKIVEVQVEGVEPPCTIEPEGSIG